MQKNQRIRYTLGRLYRGSTGAGSTALADKVKKYVVSPLILSQSVVRAKGMHYPQGKYW